MSDKLQFVATVLCSNLRQIKVAGHYLTNRFQNVCAGVRKVTDDYQSARQDDRRIAAHESDLHISNGLAKANYGAADRMMIPSITPMSKNFQSPSRDVTRIGFMTVAS
jgi:hypothetical protein